MRRKLFVISALLMLLLGTSLGMPSNVRASGKQSGAAASNGCDRACLNGFVDRYLDAVVAHDPSRLPTTKLVKFTENGQKLELGDGFWRTATSRGTYKLYVDDPQAGQVGFVGTMQEAGQPVIVALRLKIENQKISEIETIVARGQMSQNGAKNLEKMGAPRPAFLTDVPAAGRASRRPARGAPPWPPPPPPCTRPGAVAPPPRAIRCGVCQPARDAAPAASSAATD